MVAKVLVVIFKILFVLMLFIGAVFLGTLNTKEFPWGAVAALVVSFPFIIWCIRIVLDKRLTRTQKWDKLLGFY